MINHLHSGIKIDMNSLIEEAVLGPSSAFSYAVGLVPHILQLQAQNRGFHSGLGFHLGGGFHSGSGFHFRALSRCHNRICGWPACPSMIGAL